MAGPRIDDAAVELYRALIRERLRGIVCSHCGKSLGNATIDGVDSGTTLEEYQLTDAATARMLAATEHLEIRCQHCGKPGEVGRSPVAKRPDPVVPPPSPPLEADAVRLYLELIRERLQVATCGTCGAGLEGAEVVRAVGGAAEDDLALSDRSIARVLAATQHLWVTCSHCGKVGELCARSKTTSRG